MWIVFVIVVPYLGVFVYRIARGNRMQEHAQKDAEAQSAVFRAAVQDAAGTGSSAADELAKLSELKNNGAIDDAEYQRLKATSSADAGRSSDASSHRNECEVR